MPFDPLKPASSPLMKRVDPQFGPSIPNPRARSSSLPPSLQSAPHFAPHTNPMGQNSQFKGFEVLPQDDFEVLSEKDEFLVVPDKNSPSYARMVAPQQPLAGRIAGPMMSLAYRGVQGACGLCVSTLRLIGSKLIDMGVSAFCSYCVRHLSGIITKTLCGLCAEGFRTRGAKILCGVCTAALCGLGSQVIAMAGAGIICKICVGVLCAVGQEFVCMAGKEAVLAAGVKAFQSISPDTLVGMGSRLCSVGAQLSSIWQHMPAMPSMPGFRRA